MSVSLLESMGVGVCAQCVFRGPKWTVYMQNNVQTMEENFCQFRFTLLDKMNLYPTIHKNILENSNPFHFTKVSVGTETENIPKVQKFQ